MKIPTPNLIARSRAARSKDGMAAIVVLALLAIILLYVGYNARTLFNLGRELNLLEQKQTRRLSQVVIQTNTPAGNSAAAARAVP